MTAVESAIIEIDAMLVSLEPQHEGLRDYGRLNLSEATQDVIRRLIRLYDRRVVVLVEAKTALQALMADHYPDLPNAEIDPPLLADLQANADTIQAALALFTSNTANRMRLTGGELAKKT